LNINKREADIAILLEKPTKGLLYTKRLTDYRLNLYMHEDLVAEHGAPSSIEQLSPFNLVSYVPDLIYAPQLNFIEESLLSPLHALKSTSINAQFQMLRNKAGVGILPHFIAKNAHELQPVLQDKINITRTFWLATHRDVRHLARVNVFLDWLNDTVQQHADIF
jgi:DNA-binding transcriptional LysR family regulator